MNQLKLQNVDYKDYISGLKGFACFMVMIGHFIGLYKYAEDFPVESRILQFFDKFLDSKLNFVLDETFWVILFFVVSGYLVSMSKIPDIKIFVKKVAMRFLRLGIPIFFAYAVIFFIYKTVGFHTIDTIDLIKNSFIQKNYGDTYSFLQVLTAPFDVLLLGNVSLNEPYWVLREMFVSSVIIYFFSWMKNKLKNESIFLIIAFSALLIAMVISNVVFACIFGMLLCYFENNKKLLSNKISIIVIIAFCASLYIIPRSRISCMFFGALIILLPKLPMINSIFSSKFASLLGKISFGIYSFHWPIFSSIGMLLLVVLHERFNLLTASVFCSIISICATIVFSTVFYYAIEKWIYLFLKKLEKIGRKSNV